MERMRKQSKEVLGRQRVTQAKFTSRSRDNQFPKDIDESPAMTAQRQRLDGLFGGAIQRVEDEEPVQGRFETAQRKDEEEPLQGKFEAVPSIQLKEEAGKPNNTGLPDNLKSGIESLSGMSMDNVRVHYNSPQPTQLNAHAYAQGTDIHVAPGQEQHLPHEAWHVVQQAQGRVRPTMQMKHGVPVNDDHSLEHEADVMGAKAVSVGVTQAKSIESGSIDAVQVGKGPIAQLRIDHDAPDKVENNGRAAKVAVENIRGKPYSEGHNNPTIDTVFGWQQLHNAGHTLGNTGDNNSHYNAVRMHLWNGRLDGPGNKTWNLAPGPAWVNSSMSAGPEMSAKLAVDGGYWIWLDTRVSYASNNDDANDFRNVIPNRMEMQWGYMKDENNREFSGVFRFNKTLHKGDAVGGTWSADIDQPAGAMSPELRGAYAGLAADNRVGLDNKFETASPQEMAQAFHIVKDELKEYILDKYHAVFYVMGEDNKADILNNLPKDKSCSLMENVYNDSGLKGITSQVFQPLIAKNYVDRLQYLFISIDGRQNQRDLLIQSKDDLANVLGDVADDFFFNDFTLFNYLSTSQQWRKVSDAPVKMRLNLFKVVGNGTILKRLFDAWARLNGKELASERLRFIAEEFKAGELQMFIKLYRSKLKYELNNERDRNGQRRSSRLRGGSRNIPKYISVKSKGSSKMVRKINPEWRRLNY